MDMTEPLKFEVSTGRIKLSEAIRIGSRIRPQGFKGVIGQMEDGTSCSLLAAYEAIHGYPKDNFDSGRLYAWATKQVPAEMASAVLRRNDREKQSRESIATWLEEQGL